MIARLKCSGSGWAAGHSGGATSPIFFDDAREFSQKIKILHRGMVGWAYALTEGVRAFRTSSVMLPQFVEIATQILWSNGP